MTEASFAKLPGVVKTRVGYTGGTSPNPTYGSVCAGDGHTEALRIWYDPSVVSYEDLLKMFFRDHDPTQRSKCQYKSAIWYHSEQQRAAAAAAMTSLESKFRLRLATTLDPAGAWYDAEEYHQKYIDKSMSRRSSWAAW
ncbi:hypothetical protein PLESTM_000345300 [Pleodorina starrii]|nr:hypothetical protein PLESTM_000345300 [Pleodorina starrii]